MENLGVITIGEAMAMFITTKTGDLAEMERFMEHVTGVELNVATDLARLGLKVGWVSHVGNDSFGRFVLQSLAKEGIDSHAVAIDNHFATDFRMKSKVENRTDPVVEYFHKGSATSHLPPGDFHANYFTSTRHLYLSGVTTALSEGSHTLLERATKMMKVEGKTLSLDPNLRPVLWKSEAEMVKKLNRSAFWTDQVLPDLKGGVILTGQQTPEGIADFHLSRGVKAVVVKAGCDGTWFKSANGEQGTADTVEAENVVDTIDAGDSFAVGVISTLLEGEALLQVMNHDNRIGSLAIQIRGDSEGSPVHDALDE